MINSLCLFFRDKVDFWLGIYRRQRRPRWRWSCSEMGKKTEKNQENDKKIDRKTKWRQNIFGRKTQMLWLKEKGTKACSIYVHVPAPLLYSWTGVADRVSAGFAFNINWSLIARTQLSLYWCTSFLTPPLAFRHKLSVYAQNLDPCFANSLLKIWSY